MMPCRTPIGERSHHRGRLHEIGTGAQQRAGPGGSPSLTSPFITGKGRTARYGRRVASDAVVRRLPTFNARFPRSRPAPVWADSSRASSSIRSSSPGSSRRRSSPIRCASRRRRRRRFRRAASRRGQVRLAGRAPGQDRRPQARDASRARPVGRGEGALRRRPDDRGRRGAPGAHPIPLHQAPGRLLRAASWPRSSRTRSRPGQGDRGRAGPGTGPALRHQRPAVHAGRIHRAHAPHRHRAAGRPGWTRTW